MFAILSACANGSRKHSEWVIAAAGSRINVSGVSLVVQAAAEPATWGTLS